LKTPPGRLGESRGAGVSRSGGVTSLRKGKREDSKEEEVEKNAHIKLVKGEGTARQLKSKVTEKENWGKNS